MRVLGTCGECSCLAAALVFAFLSPGCAGYGPSPRRSGFGRAGGTSTGTVPHYLREAYSRSDFPDTFGYLSLGAVPYAEISGDVEGLEPGKGVTGTIPLTRGVGVIVVVIMIVALLAAAGGGGGSGGGGSWGSGSGGGGGGDWDREMWVCGWRNRPASSTLCEYSFDFSFAVTSHEDALQGGEATFAALMIGGRLGTPRQDFPRVYVAGGVGYYGIFFPEEIPARTDASAFGPYVGLGVEAFVLENIALGVECRGHLFAGEDEAGEEFSGAAAHLMGSVCWFW